MIHVSGEFREQMEVRTDFKEQAEVTFLDGTKLSLTEDDFTVSNNSITDGAGSSGLPLGAAIQRQIQMELMNDDDHLEKYDFVGAKIRLYMTFWLPKTKELKERIEKIECGYFTVTKPETYGQTVIVVAVDDMYRADKAFYSDLIFPASASELFVEMCKHCGIQPGNTLFRNNDFMIKEKPSGSDLTFRTVFGYLAMLAAGNARISRQGALEILSYDFSVFDQEVQVQELRNFNSLKIGTEDVVITGIRMKVKGKTAEEDQTFLCGEEGYLLEIDNPLVAGQEQQLVDSIGQRLIGIHLRDFSGDHIAYPLAEFMDPVYVEDRKGRKYPSVLTDVNFTFFGITTFKNSAVSAIRNGGKFSSGASKTYEEARDLITKEREARDTAIENLARELESSSGLFCTKEERPDGSTIYYMHDKAKLSDSMIIWKITAEAIGISTDGGKTYPTGIDATGMAILNKIYAIGIDANYINAGELNAAIVKIKNLHLQDISDSKGVTLDATLDGITADVSSKYTELDGKISTNTSSISLLPESISASVKKSYIDPLDKRMTTAETNISQAANSISASVKKNYIDPLATRMDSAETSIKLNAESIESKVSKGSVISSINQSAEKITISADKIDFNGSVTFSNAVKNASDALSTAKSASSTASSAASTASSASTSVNKLSSGLTSGTTKISGNCIDTGRIQVGTASYLDMNGSFRIGSMQAVGELKDDVEFKHAIFVDYGIELLAGNDGATPYIDFHTEATSHDNAKYDYTARIQNTQNSWITFYGLSDGKNDPAACTVQAGQFRGSFVDVSDRRLKENIVDLNLDDVLADLMKYRPVSYKYINGVDTNIHHGLIAQEAQEIAEWGLVDDRGQYLAIHYTELIADLIKAMQYSLAEIEKLKAAIAA